MGWALDGGEDVGGDLATSDFLAEKLSKLYTDRERREIALQGKFIIVCNSQYNGKKLYYQDRNISKRGFWTRYKNNAFGFESKKAAEYCCRKLRYNNARIEKVG